MFSKRASRQAGFTVVELIVAMVVMGLLIGLVLGTLGSYYQGNINTLTVTTQDTDTRSVLRSIERELADSNAFLASPSVPYGDPQGMNNGTDAWSYKGKIDAATTNRRVLIAQTYATDKNAEDESRLPIFTNVGSGCGPSVAAPASINRIYFVARDPDASVERYNLYRRILVPTASLCGAPIQKRTCAPADMDGAATACEGSDALLVNDVRTLNIDYYTSPNDKDPIADQYSTSVDKTALIRGAKSVKITVTSNRTIEGSVKVSEASIRVSRPY